MLITKQQSKVHAITKQYPTKRLGKGLLVLLVLGCMYSFGSFGFLNLFGIRVYVQSILVTLAILPIYFFRISSSSWNTKLILIFIGLFVFGGVVNGGVLLAPVEGAMLGVLIYVILNAKSEDIIFLCRAFVLMTFVFSLLVSFAYIYYMVNPSDFNFANINIYDSTTGNEKIYPGFFVDWISFTSGDGFVMADVISQRMKGYSNEPSSTIVHYLAPAILAFALGGIYIIIGYLICLVNIVAIASMTGHICLVLAIIFLILMSIKKSIRVGILLLMTPFLSITLLNLSVAEWLMSLFSEYSQQFFGYDLIGRKLGDGISESSLSARHTGIVNGLEMIITSPIGYSYEKLGAGAGWLYSVSATTGWVGLIIFLYFIIKALRLSYSYILANNSLTSRFGVSLFWSAVFVSLFISGYGWDRLPGYIFILVCYRLYEAKYRNLTCPT